MKNSTKKFGSASFNASKVLGHKRRPVFELNKDAKNIEISSYKDSVTNENHWSALKFGKAQSNAEKPYERPLALFN